MASATRGRWPKSLATLALLAIVRRVPPGAVRCRSLRSRHRPSPGLRRSLKFAKSLRQENASIFYDSGTSQTRRTLYEIFASGKRICGNVVCHLLLEYGGEIGMRFTCIDFETANSNYESVCAVGIALFEKGQLVDSKSWLVKPHEDYYY